MPLSGCTFEMLILSIYKAYVLNGLSAASPVDNQGYTITFFLDFCQCFHTKIIVGSVVKGQLRCRTCAISIHNHKKCPSKCQVNYVCFHNFYTILKPIPILFGEESIIISLAISILIILHFRSLEYRVNGGNTIKKTKMQGTM